MIDLNYYAIPSTEGLEQRWRNIGLGVMGLQDVFFQMRLPFDSDEASELSAKIQEEIYYAALTLRATWPGERGAHPHFTKPVPHRAFLQFDLWGVAPDDTERWDALRGRIQATRAAQLADDRDRTDRDHRLDRRLLRMHRAAGVESFQTRNAFRRFRAGQ